MIKRTAIITGAGGQDGSYLAEQLLGKGYHVIGLVRREPTSYRFLEPLRGKIDVEPDAPDDPEALRRLVRRVTPDEYYNLAARASSATLFDQPAAMGIENGIRVAQMLELLLQESPQTRFCQAGSSEMFGTPTTCPQDETTGFRPRNPYGAAKLFAHVAIQTYRQRHGMFACNAILYNHESPRRAPEMVTRKVAIAAARAYRGLPVALTLGNLNAQRDWGYAGDYVRVLWLMLQHHIADDYVVATGKLHSVHELCETAFAHVGLDYRAFTGIDANLARPSEAVPLCGDGRRARDVLGWTPEVSFTEMIHAMVDAEIMAIDHNLDQSTNHD